MKSFRSVTMLTLLSALGVSLAVACGSSTKSTGTGGAGGGTSTGGHAGSTTVGPGAGGMGAAGSSVGGSAGSGGNGGATTGGSAGTTSTGTGGSAGMSSGGSAGSGGSGGNPAVACQTMCQQAHRSGAQALFGAYQSDCICSTSSPCATPCATSYCHGTSPMTGDACDTCITNTYAADANCISKVDGVATNNADAQALLTCFSNCNGAQTGVGDCAPASCQSFFGGINTMCSAQACNPHPTTGGTGGSGGSAGSGGSGGAAAGSGGSGGAAPGACPSGNDCVVIDPAGTAVCLQSASMGSASCTGGSFFVPANPASGTTPQTSQACSNGCFGSNSGLVSVQRAFINDCICGAGTMCASACASNLCNPNVGSAPTGSACDMCFQTYVMSPVPMACQQMVDQVVAMSTEAQSGLSCLNECTAAENGSSNFACAPGNCLSYVSSTNLSCSSPTCSGSSGTGGTSGSSCAAGTTCIVTNSSTNTGYCWATATSVSGCAMGTYPIPLN